MREEHVITVATLNVKGLNNRIKCKETLTLLKSYNIDIILIQETNLHDTSMQNFFKSQLYLESIWSSKTAILAGNKRISFSNQQISHNGRVITVNFQLKHKTFQVTNVYAPPSIPERREFLETWAPSIKNNVINIVAGDFNTNLNPTENRISQSQSHHDPTKNKLAELMEGFTDTAYVSKEKPFITYHQTVRDRRTMATRLDYIFLDNDHFQLCKKSETKFGNSDHLLVWCSLYQNQETPKPTLWKLNPRMLNNTFISKELEADLKDEKAISDWDYYKVRCQSIYRACKPPTALETHIQKLNKKIMELNNKMARNPQLADLSIVVMQLNSELQEELKLLTKKWQLRSNIKWLEEGEKSTKYFFEQYKARTSREATDLVRNPELPGSLDRVDILQYIRDQFEQIYQDEPVDAEAVEALTADIPLVSQQQNKELTKEIKLQEIIDTIDKLPNYKAPGSDGLTYEFYKAFCDKISPVLKNIFNKALSLGVIPDSWRKSIITLLPKKNEALENISNWRPISLVNADAKIFMKIIADRLNHICKDIIGEHQAGFVKNRSIVDAALDIISTMRSQENQIDTAWLLFLDQKKAFDRVNHSYLLRVLGKMGFSPVFVKLIQNLFGNLIAHITDTGLLSTPFKIRRGVRQGDPLSPLLYIIAFEPLLRLLGRKINGVPTGTTSFKITAYADDLTLGLGSLEDWNTANNLLATYEAAANAKVNKEKSKLLPLTEKASCTILPEEERFEKLEENGTIRILGFEVNKKGQPNKSLWDNLTTKLKKLAESMKRRGLSFKGRIIIAKSLLLSRVWFASYILPPNRKQLAKINEIIIHWIKDKSRLLPRYSLYQQTQENNGLNAPVLPDMLDARLIIVWVKLWSSKKFWAINERLKIEAALLRKQNKTIQKALSTFPIRLKGWPCEWKPYLTAWKRLKGEVPDNNKTWPWDLEDLKIIETTAGNITTAKATAYLKKLSLSNSLTQTNFFSEPNRKENWAWSGIKWASNNKKDIFWRLLHKALPLGTRLVYMDPMISRNCPWCSDEVQTFEHFARDCRVSRKIWELAYNMFGLVQKITLPSTMEEIFTASKAKSSRSHTSFIWLHILVIYEIWVWYTNKRWALVLYQNQHYSLYGKTESQEK